MHQRVALRHHVASVCKVADELDVRRVTLSSYEVERWVDRMEYVLNSLERFAQNTERYWHATSRSRAQSIVKEGVLRTQERSVYAIPAEAMSPREFMEDMAYWFVGRGYYPDDIAIVEFTTDRASDRRKGIIEVWEDDVALNDPYIAHTGSFDDLRTAFSKH